MRCSCQSDHHHWLSIRWPLPYHYPPAISVVDPIRREPDGQVPLHLPQLLQLPRPRIQVRLYIFIINRAIKICSGQRLTTNIERGILNVVV